MRTNLGQADAKETVAKGHTNRKYNFTENVQLSFGFALCKFLQMKQGISHSRKKTSTAKGLTVTRRKITCQISEKNLLVRT